MSTLSLGKFSLFMQPLLIATAMVTATNSLQAMDLLMHPDLPPGILYPSGHNDPQPAVINPVIGNPNGAYSGSDYYAIQTGSVVNGGTAYGGIVFQMPLAFTTMPVPQRYKLEYAISGTSLDSFQLHMNNQDGLGQLNRLSHITDVTPNWVRHTRYATLDGLDWGGHANIPRNLLFINSNNQWGGPGARFLIDDITLSPVPIGDFDENDVYDCTDVDALVAAIATGGFDTKFDLTDDGSLDINDLDAWRDAAGAALFGVGQSVIAGDANLDGLVDASDFNRWNSHKFTAVPAWCSGDFYADGNVDISDFNTWNANKFTSVDAVNTVPEPSAAWLLLMGFCLLKQLLTWATRVVSQDGAGSGTPRRRLCAID